MLLIFAYCYSLFEREFAQLYVQLPFLDFPIFVGEILLATCLILLLFLRKHHQIELEKWHYLLLLYIGWLLWKALTGYFQFGPLALRTASLFYYPLFAVIGFYFFDKRYITFPLIILMLVILLVTVKPVIILVDYYFAYLAILIFLTFQIKKRWVQLILCLLIVWIYPWYMPFGSARTKMVGFIVASIFLAICICFAFLKNKKLWRNIVLCILLCILSFGVLKFADKVRLKTFYRWDSLIELYHKHQEVIAQREDDFSFKTIKPRLYNKENIELNMTDIDIYVDRTSRRALSSLEEGSRIGIEAIVRSNFLIIKNKAEDVVVEVHQLIKQDELLMRDASKFADSEMEPDIQSAVLKIEQEIDSLYIADEKGVSNDLSTVADKEKMMQEIEQMLRNLVHMYFSREIMMDVSEERAFGNVLFRYYIWKDMVKEMIQAKAWWGINFGKPLRSKSIEILEFAKDAWLRDGWIAAHNSFLYMVYRAGVVGGILIVLLIVVLIFMIKQFIVMKSLAGILSCSILINFMVQALFLLTLEVPYTAITYWSLFGMTLAYSKEIGRGKIS